MRTRILVGMSLTAAVLAGTAAPALAAPAAPRTAAACEATVFADEVTTHDLGTRAADGWTVQCASTRHVKVKIDYVTGRSVVAEADVAAGTRWQGLDLNPSDDGRGVNSVVSVYENGQLLTQVALNWD